MGTSNWQQIPFCIDALMKMAPTRVLDVGVGFGRWGMIVREFCDVWYSRVFKDQWQVHIEGIEAFEKSITAYHREFYNSVHIGDAAALIPTLPGPWSVTIYGDVLEHFTKEKATELLNKSLDCSEYVIVNIPIGEEHPQGEMYGNAFERHLSSWNVDDFRPFGLVRHILLKDYIARDYGSFILSRNDPKDLRTSLFSKCSPYHSDAAALATTGDDLEKVLSRISEQAFELSFIKGSASYRLANRLRRAPIAKVARNLKTGAANRLRIRPLRRPGTGEGPEAWVLSVHAAPGEPGIPWEFVERTQEFEERTSEPSAYGRCLVGCGGELSVRTGPDPSVRFLTHPWSSVVEVAFNGRRELIDLCTPTSGVRLIHPGRTPMAAPLPAVALEAAPMQPQEPAPAPQPTAPEVSAPFTAGELATIERLRREAPAAVAIHCPRWLGVTNSTRTLFGEAACYPVPPTAEEDPHDLTDAQLRRHASILVAAGVERLVVSGGDLTHLRLVDVLREAHPDIVCDLLWHGSYVQIAEDYAWLALQRWMEAARDGRIRSILTVKAGMEEFFRATGIASDLLYNYIPGEPLPPPAIEGDELHVGLWISNPSFRKVPHAMICALPMLERVRLHGSGLDPRALELIEFLSIPTATIDHRLSGEQLRAAIRKTHVSLYVTYSECCPMLPLESLQQGVPCLVGPVSHLFEDNPYLHERLVVPTPDRADVIARYTRRAAAEREEIIAQWARYAPRYNAEARATVERFLARGAATPDAVPVSMA